MTSRTFHDTFLDELARLDAYLSEVGGGAPEAPQSSDPEVRRLLEATAFFSARTQEMAYRGAFDAVSWLLAEQCDFLRRPLVARGLVQACDAGGWSSAIRLPQRTPLLVESAEGTVGQFATAVSAVVAPLAVVDLRLERAPGERWLLLEVEAPLGFAELEWLSLYVDVLGDRRRSLSLHRRLRWACRSARYWSVKTEPGSRRRRPELSELRELPALDVRFGRRRGELGDDAPSALEAVRAHFQLPEQNLFLNVLLPAQRDDQRAWIALELEPEGPEFPCSKGAFRPNVLPIENEVRAPSDPIVEDGRTTDHWVLPPAELSAPGFGDPASGYELLEVKRVSEVHEKHEVTLLSSSIAEPERSYRLGWRSVDGKERPLLRLSAPGTPERPRRLRLNATWTQPGLDLRALSRLRLRPWRLALPHVELKPLPASAPFVPSPLSGDPEKLLDVAALTNRSWLGRDELVHLLKLLGAGAHVWGKCVDAVESVRWREVTSSGAGAGTELEVTLRARVLGDELEALQHDLSDRIQDVLNAWCDAPVRVLLETIALRAPLRLAEGGA